MPESKMKLTAGAIPYSDGSGDQVTATVERTDEGLMLRFEMIHQIPLSKWAEARDKINELVQSARKIDRANG